MIIEVEEGDTKGCVAHFGIPSTGISDQVRVRLLDINVPDPPLIDRMTGAISTDIDTFDSPEFRNMFEVVDWLDRLLDSVSNERLIESYWDGLTFELNILEKPVTLSAEFAILFNFPTTIPVDTIVDSGINLQRIDVSDGYVVELRVGEAEGFYKGTEYTNIVASFPRGSNKAISDYWFRTREPLSSGYVRVYSRRISDGSLREIEVRPGERWSARIELEVTQARYNVNRTF